MNIPKIKSGRITVESIHTDNLKMIRINRETKYCRKLGLIRPAGFTVLKSNCGKAFTSSEIIFTRDELVIVAKAIMSEMTAKEKLKILLEIF